MNSSLTRRAVSKSSIFSTSSEESSSLRMPESALDSNLKESQSTLANNLAAVTTSSRRSSRSSQRIRRESGDTFSRLLHVSSSMRRRSTEKAHGSGGNKTNGLLHLRQWAHTKLKEEETRAMWRKLRLWSRIIYVLFTQLQKHAAFAVNDPSSPFYNHRDGEEKPLSNAIDRDHYLFFDQSQFRANRQRRMSTEVQRILTKPPEDRTPEEIHFAMIGLRDIPQLAVFPVRMQQNLAHFGYFESYEAKRMVLKQGHRAESYYFILYGNVVVAVKHEETGYAQVITELSKGDTFGDLAVVSDGTRRWSVLTKTETDLLSISNSIYERIFMSGGLKNINDPDQQEFLSSIACLHEWPLQKLYDTSSQHNFRFMYIRRNTVITKDSNCNTWLIIVKSGSITVLKKLMRAKPTVSKRSGLLPVSAGPTAFLSFLYGERNYASWLSQRGVTSPLPLQLHHEQDANRDTEQELNEKLQSLVLLLQCRTRLNVQFHVDPCDSEAGSVADITPEVTIVRTKQTLLDEVNKVNKVTERDRSSQFVYVHTLTKGDVFGLAPLLFADQPSLCLVSNGAECLLFDKRFYMDNCPPQTLQRLKTEVSPYPTEQKLQEDLINRMNWDVYKQVVIRHVLECSPKRVAVAPFVK